MNQKGYTLLAVMLFLVILGAAVAIGLNYTEQKTDELYRDKAAMQMQQILNAGLAYYITDGSWPTTGTTASPEQLNASSLLLTKNFILTTPISPWGQPYYIAANKTTDGNNTFVVSTTTNSQTEAVILASRLPMGVASGTAVSAQVNVPGQNVANARSVNFSAVYHNNGCVPVPSCPPGTSPKILVAPAAAQGLYNSTTCTDANDPSTCTSNRAVDITGVVATANPPATVDGTAGTGPNSCDTSAPTGCSAQIVNSGGSNTPTYITSGKFWRVCIKVTTALGVVNPNTPAWAELAASVVAFTRCATDNEPSGSDMKVFDQGS